MSTNNKNLIQWFTSAKKIEGDNQKGTHRGFKYAANVFSFKLGDGYLEI